jgi:hypothetical protein
LGTPWHSTGVKAQLSENGPTNPVLGGVYSDLFVRIRIRALVWMSNSPTLDGSFAAHCGPVAQLYSAIRAA